LTGSSCHGRGDRGFALIAALLIALLFFGLMELALRDTTEAVRAAHRHRARLASEILADNAVELAAEGMIDRLPRTAVRSGRDGEMSGVFTPLPGDRFELSGEGTSAGTTEVRTRILLRGRQSGGAIVIEESETR
jgi:hypothetical protein